MNPVNRTMPAEIQDFYDRCTTALANQDDTQACISFVKAELPRLLLNKALFVGLMENIVNRQGYPDAMRPTVFDNEIPLFVHPDGLFSLRLYLWGPEEFTYPHDHNSWGVLGAVSPGFEVINYRREDDGSREGFAQLSESERFLLGAGETCHTLPFNDGIHITGNPDDSAVLSLNFYGRVLPRGYLYRFNIHKQRAYRVYPPRRKKEILAGQALEFLRRGL